MSFDSNCIQTKLFDEAAQEQHILSEYFRYSGLGTLASATSMLTNVLHLQEFPVVLGLDISD